MKKWSLFGAIVAGLGFAASIAESSEGGGGGVPNPAEGWDTLWLHLMIDLWVIGIIFAGICIIFMFKYVRRSDDQEGDAPKLSIGNSIAWALVPSLLFLADDFYLAAQGWKLWIDQRTVPENAMEIKLTAHMYDWSFEYENGAASETDVVVPQGRPVVFRMTSEDTIHSFWIPDMRIKEDVMPGRVTFIWINPVKEGEHILTCTEYCGVGHSDMFGKLKIVSPEKFEEWSSENKA